MPPRSATVKAVSGSDKPIFPLSCSPQSPIPTVAASLQRSTIIQSSRGALVVCLLLPIHKLVIEQCNNEFWKSTVRYAGQAAHDWCVSIVGAECAWSGACFSYYLAENVILTVKVSCALLPYCEQDIKLGRPTN